MGDERRIFLTTGGLSLAVLAIVAAVGWHSTRLRATRFSAFPHVTLWAWERPEDLRGLDPHRFAVAYLDRTIIVTDRVDVVPRRQPLEVAPGAQVIAVVRIEASAGTADISDPALSTRLAGIIAESAVHRQVDGVQVDFDARVSQRAFYAQMLQQLRLKLPKGFPLSITALASWCAYDDWIKDLPIDEAVPMYFRMGPEHPPASASGWSYPVREPLCRNVAGVSTDEAWPQLNPGTRVYVFHPRAWSSVALNNLEGYWPR